MAKLPNGKGEQHMFSILIRLALTSALAALAALAASYWQNEFQRQLDGGLTNMLVIGSGIVLSGLAMAVWSFRTRLFGLVMRALLSLPFAAFIVFVVVWIRPTRDQPLAVMFFTGLCAACALLIAAIWSYWPKKA
jgi:hypothetical protein